MKVQRDIGIQAECENLLNSGAGVGITTSANIHTQEAAIQAQLSLDSPMTITEENQSYIKLKDTLLTCLI